MGVPCPKFQGDGAPPVEVTPRPKGPVLSGREKVVLGRARQVTVAPARRLEQGKVAETAPKREPVGAVVVIERDRAEVNKYQRDYMRRYRARKRAEREQK